MLLTFPIFVFPQLAQPLAPPAELYTFRHFDLRARRLLAPRYIPLAMFDGFAFPIPSPLLPNQFRLFDPKWFSEVRIRYPLGLGAYRGFL